MKHRKRTLYFFLCVMCAFALSFVFYFTAGLGSVELKLFDLRARMLPYRVPATGQTVCGLIDDQSISAIGPWPWPRKIHALFLDSLRKIQPAVIAYDLKFFSDTPDDDVFAATAGYFDSLCFAYDFRLEKSGRNIPDSDDSLKRIKNLAPFELSGIDARKAGLRAGSVMLPVPSLGRYGLGFANAPRDTDGVLRRLPLMIAFEGKVYPSFALFCVCRALGIDFKDVRLGRGCVELIKDNKIVRLIPVDAHASMLVYFSRSGHEPFESYLYVQLLKSGRAPAEGKTPDIDLNAFGGKIIMLGHTATGSIAGLDVGATPVSSYTPYMFAHAQAAENILSGKHLRLVSWPANVGFALCVVALCALFGFYLRPLFSLFSVIGLLCAGAGINLYFFSCGLVLNLTLFLLCVFLTYLASTGFRLVIENRDKRFLKKVFGHYVSAPVLESVLSEPGSLKLGGEKRELTVMFADIRGFTAYCESSDPELVVSQLNEYFDVMTRIICANAGTLDKYIGDCIMAVFGAPSLSACPDHAFMAVKSALEMQEALKELQKKWAEEGSMVLDIGVGINTGTMLVGNLGSSMVWDYTVVGDEVNLAARLEALTREHGAAVIVSESTYRKVENRVRAERIGAVKVKGKSRETVVYSVNSFL